MDLKKCYFRYVNFFFFTQLTTGHDTTKNTINNMKSNLRLKKKKSVSSETLIDCNIYLVYSMDTVNTKNANKLNTTTALFFANSLEKNKIGLNANQNQGQFR